MKLNKIFLLLVLPAVCWSFVIQEKTAWITIQKDELQEVSRKATAFFEEKTRFSVNVTHQTFKGHFAAQPYDQSTGYIRRDGNYFHSYMIGIHTYQDLAYRFVVDTVQKKIMVSDRKKFEARETIDWENFMAQKNMLSCRKSSMENKSLYRVDYAKGYSVEATEMLFNSNHSLAAITIFFHREIATSPNNEGTKAKPMAKIIYSDYKFTPAFKTGEFVHTRFFTTNGKQLVLTTKYKNYQLFDNRINKNQTND